MIGNECIHVTNPKSPWNSLLIEAIFKLHMGDTGLLVTQIMKSQDNVDENIYKSLIFGKLGINQRMIIENMVAQMLKASGHDLYFHKYRYTPSDESNEKKYEIDFLTVKNKKICPIEVKSFLLHLAQILITS